MEQEQKKKKLKEFRFKVQEVLWVMFEACCVAGVFYGLFGYACPFPFGSLAPAFYDFVLR